MHDSQYLSKQKKTRHQYTFNAFSLGLSLLLITPFAHADTKPTPKKAPPTKVVKTDKAKKNDKLTSKASPLNKSAWDGSNISLGINITTGNTRTQNYNTQLNVNFTKYHWTNLFNSVYQRGRSNDILTKNVYSLQEQLQYSFNNNNKLNNYAYAMSIYKRDQFGPFTYQSTSTAGYGRDWIKNDKVAFSTQVGPGYRCNQDDQGTTRSSLIGFIQSVLMWKVTSFSTFNQTFQDTYGLQYNYLTSDTAITNKLVGNLAIQMEYTVSYYSKIPRNSANTKKVDTTLNINVLYNF